MREALRERDARDRAAARELDRPGRSIVDDIASVEPATGTAVNVCGLVKAFGTQRLFDGLDLAVGHGERLALLGASGCGKSTLLRCLAGLERLDGGTIEVRDEVGFVFQEPRLFPWLSVEANVAFAARTPVERARVAGVVELVGLSNARAFLPKALSGGMAQRAGLARALVRSPKVLLLDEPLAALDALRRLELRSALRTIVAAGAMTAILVTHDVDEALDFAQRCVVMVRSANGVALEPSVRADDPQARLVLLRQLGLSV